MNLLKKFLRDELFLNPDKYLPAFEKYEKLLLEWNKKINLVSRKTESIEEHILNSIFFLTKYDFRRIKKFVDIGTGGGFPGIPLKILFPDSEALLVDSIQKKINVVKDIAEKMNIQEISAVCGRAESVSVESIYLGSFDCVISKAVAPLEDLYQWGKYFLKPSGEIISIKGGNIGDELQQLESMKKKLKYNFNFEVIKFEFDTVYKIEDKKLVVIKNADA